MIDTHSHIDTEIFDADRDQLLERAWQAGVEAIVIPSIDPSGFDKLQRLVDSDSRLYRGVGVHPHNVALIGEEELKLVESGLGATRVVAVGEIGLDYYYDFAPKDVQQNMFREQLRIAKGAKLPVIVHNREADEDILRILREEQDGSLRGVLHCFSSSLDVLHQCLEVGFHVSFTGNVTFKNSTLADVVREVPADRFMIETDAPYITPVPHRGKRNEPSYVGLIAEKIAQIRSLSTDEVLQMTTTTARSFFGILGLLAVFALSSFSALAQTEDESTHPYLKKIGIGGIATTNTIVEARTYTGKTDAESFSWPGISSFGGMLCYEINDRFMLDADYIYTNNKTVLRDTSSNPFGQEHTDRHHTFELSLRYLWNPYSRVVFYLSLGPTYFVNAYNGGDGAIDNFLKTTGHTSSTWGLAAGLGLFINIKTPYGMVVPGGEWRVDTFLASEDRVLIENGKPVNANISTLFSLPRFTLSFFPNI